MNYRLRDDVVLEKIGGIYIFVALRSAWEECPFAIQAAPSLAYIWELMKDGYMQEQIIHLLITEKKMDPVIAEKNFSFFVKQALKFHYLIEENDPC